jgi:hypothetical protein
MSFSGEKTTPVRPASAAASAAKEKLQRQIFTAQVYVRAQALKARWDANDAVHNDSMASTVDVVKRSFEHDRRVWNRVKQIAATPIAVPSTAPSVRPSTATLWRQRTANSPSFQPRSEEERPARPSTAGATPAKQLVSAGLPPRPLMLQTSTSAAVMVATEPPDVVAETAAAPEDASSAPTATAAADSSIPNTAPPPKRVSSATLRRKIEALQNASAEAAERRAKAPPPAASKPPKPGITSADSSHHANEAAKLLEACGSLDSLQKTWNRAMAESEASQTFESISGLNRLRAAAIFQESRPLLRM